jgi:pimeloyl-ACP methyl ester carboxylesterase
MQNGFMPFFVEQDTKIHYFERGCGEPLLLIHGLGCSGADWALQAAALESRYRLIIPDLPGSGRSPAPLKYCIEQYARQLWRLMDHLQIERANIVGFSLGGAVAMTMAMEAPARVSRLALINSVADFRPRSIRKWLETYVTAALVHLIGMPRTACLGAARLFPNSWQRVLRERCAAVVGAVPAAAYLGMGLALTRWSIAHRLGPLPARSLILAAEDDFTPLDEKHALAKILGGEIVVVRGSRHATHIDSVRITNACLLAFLTDAPLPPKAQWRCDEADEAREFVRDGALDSDLVGLPAD